jgi:hypothetical protein
LDQPTTDHRAQPASARYTITRRKSTFRDFVRLFLAVRRQPQFQRYTGSLTWLLYLAMLPSAYAFRWLKGLPEVIIVSEGDRLMSGIMISPDGWLTNFVSVGDEYRKPRAALRGYLELRRLLDQPEFAGRKLRLRTADYNRSQIQALQRLGFVISGRQSYMITAALGPFRFSWPAAKPRHGQLFHVEHQVVLEYPSAQG